jgi:hypothetical protein
MTARSSLELADTALEATNQGNRSMGEGARNEAKLTGRKNGVEAA